jgi:hypothetical protein
VAELQADVNEVEILIPLLDNDVPDGVRVREAGPPHRPARQRQLTDSSRPGILLWREGNPAGEEVIQCAITEDGSGAAFTRAVTFPAGESKIWLELPELASGDPGALASYTVRIGEATGRLQLVPASGLPPGGTQRALVSGFRHFPSHHGQGWDSIDEWNEWFINRADMPKRTTGTSDSTSP